MSENRDINKHESNEPIMDFISGYTNTKASKRLTKKIISLRSLWLLAKMTGSAKK